MGCFFCHFLVLGFHSLGAARSAFHCFLKYIALSASFCFVSSVKDLRQSLGIRRSIAKSSEIHQESSMSVEMSITSLVFCLPTSHSFIRKVDKFWLDLVSDSKTKQKMTFVWGSELFFSSQNRHFFSESPVFWWFISKRAASNKRASLVFFQKKCYSAGTSIRDRRVDINIIMQ